MTWAVSLKLLVVSLVLLPVLPNRDMGPWAAINPYELWLMVILIAGVSFIGYIAITLGGRRPRGDSRPDREPLSMVSSGPKLPGSD